MAGDALGEGTGDGDADGDGVHDRTPPRVSMNRLDLGAHQIGFHSGPPCRVDLKFSRRGDRWSAFVLTGAGRMRDVLRWLQDYDCTIIHVASGVAPRVARVEFEMLPDALEGLLDSVQVKTISLMSAGVAAVLIHDESVKVARLVEAFQSSRVQADRVPTDPTLTLTMDDDIGITHRQKEAVLLAVALGYYEVPHRVSLRQIADRMGVSLGALSELLRRGESAILSRFTHAIMESNWESVEGEVEKMKSTKDDPSSA